MFMGSNKYIILALSVGAVVSTIFAHQGDKEKTLSAIGDAVESTLSTAPSKNNGARSSKVSPSLLPAVSSSKQVTVAGDTKLSPARMVSPEVTPQVTPQVTPTNNGLSPTVSPTVTMPNDGRVVINEIGWSGTLASAFDEWIELYNNESFDVDMSGWALTTESESPKIIFPNGTHITARGYFLIERTDDNAISDIKADYTTGFGNGLSDSGEVLLLKNTRGEIDRVGTWGDKWHAGESASRLSMERIDPLVYSNGPSNWKTFFGNSTGRDAKGNSIKGTPKSSNSTATPAPTPQVSPSPSPSPSPTQLVTPTMSPTVTTSPTPLATVTPLPTPEVTPVLTTSPQATPTPTPQNTNQVVINEIAWMGTGSSASDEWIELYNYSTLAIDISGWTLKSLTGSNPDPQINMSGLIAANGYFLLERTDDTSVYDVSANQTYTGALSDSCEILELRDNNGVLIDKVTCGDNGWYGGNKDSRSTMERVNTGSGESQNSWGTNDGVTKNGLDASGSAINGTPGKTNSVNN